LYEKLLPLPSIVVYLTSSVTSRPLPQFFPVVTQ